MCKTYKIGVIPGDGTGPEVVQEGIKVLKAAAAKTGFGIDFCYCGVGAEHYLSTGEILTNEHLDFLAHTDGVYLGAIGHPDVQPGILEQGIVLRIRSFFDQYVNVRPVKLYEGVTTPIKGKKPEDIDFVIIRENTEGLYVGAGGFLKKGTPDEVAIQESINTRRGVERCIRFAFDYCMRRNKRNKLTLCAKTNVLTYASDLWERTFYEVKRDYPQILTDYIHIDAACMRMVKDPEWFDVIVTDNMFGDILTDLGAMIQGGMGLSPGGNINPNGLSMFEPAGGSAPKYAGQGKINPIAAMLAGSLMLHTLGESEAASMIEAGVSKVLRENIKDVAAGKMGYTTEEVGDLVAGYIGEIS